MRRRITLAIAALAIAPIQATSQTTLDFEGVGNSVFSSYAGFTWTGSAGNNSWVGSSFGPSSIHRPTSGTTNAWSNGGARLDMSRATAFNFNSVFISAANGSCGQSPAQTVRGFLGGVELFSRTFTLNCTVMVNEVFNFIGVDMVRFEVASPSAVNLLLDDVTYGEVNSVPEPATMTLMATGLFGLAGAARRRREKQIQS